MYNLMIIEKNPYQLVEMVNYISEKCQNIRICYLSYTVKNILNILEKNTIDIILLNIEMSDTNLIEYIEEHNLYQYKNSIIIKVNSLYRYKKNKYVFTYISELSTIPKEIKKLITYKTDISNLKNIKNEIRKELTNLDYNYSYHGTKYLEETILELYKVKFEFDGNLSKNIYPTIAKRYQKTVDTIYGNIKQATNSMISKCDRRKLMDYLGYSYYYTKPKIQEIIFIILNKIDK